MIGRCERLCQLPAYLPSELQCGRLYVEGILHVR